MQSGKDMAASAKAGMDKTKATLQEKGERMTTRDPLQKEMATERKGERIDEAERRKQEARERNTAAAGGGMFGAGGRDNTTGGELGGYDDTTDASMGRPTEADYTVEETGGGLGRRGPKTGGGARTGYGGGNDNSLI